LRDAQFAAARARLRSAAALEQQGRADVALAVQTAYFAAVAARAEAAIQRDTVRTLRDYVALLRRQVALGLVPQNDVLRADLGVETARTAHRAALAQLEAARSELSVLTGEEVSAAALVEPDAAPFTEATAAMVEASPVLVDARAAADAARREADAVSSEWRAHMTLTASGGALGVDPGPTFRDNGGGQFLLGFTLPVFDSGATAAKIAAAIAAAKGADAGILQARQTVTVGLARARVEAQHAQADLAASRRALPKAEAHFQLMRARYFGGGNVRLLEVLDSLNQYVDVRLSEPRALRTYRDAAATARQILGEATP
jgi:outer membrane protein TolC